MGHSAHYSGFNLALSTFVLSILEFLFIATSHAENRALWRSKTKTMQRHTHELSGSVTLMDSEWVSVSEWYHYVTWSTTNASPNLSCCEFELRYIYRLMLLRSVLAFYFLVFVVKLTNVEISVSSWNGRITQTAD